MRFRFGSNALGGAPLWKGLGILFLCIASRAEGAETLRIVVAEDLSEVAVSARDMEAGADSPESPPTLPLPGSTAHLQARGEALWVNGNRWSGGAIRLHSPEEKVRLGGRSLRGEVVVKMSRGRLSVVNVLPLEDYLVGVLGAEMPVWFPPEALKAQAVAARTYALRRKMETFGGEAHLGSGVLSQVYKGLEEEAPSARAAVKATSGEVLTYQLEPIEAYFHSSCGGRTESGKDALARALPYLQPVDCPCGQERSTRWSLWVSAAELRKLFGKVDTQQFGVVSRSPTGRVQRVRIGPGHELDGVTFRQKLGYGKLRSLWFEVADRRPGELRLTGRGFGHGAGMCQWGAKLLAQEGWSYRRILAHYYPGTEIQSLY